MLKQRLITALLLAPLAIGCILYFPTWASSALFGAFLVVGIVEWGKLTAIKVQSRWYHAAAFVALALILYRVAGEPGYRAVISTLVVGMWLLIASFVVYAQLSGKITLNSAPGRMLRSPVACLIVLLGAFVSAVELLREDPAILLLVFVAVWSADVGAYFAGKNFGAHKLAVNISPGKTWEGVAGGLFLSAVALAVGAQWILTSSAQWFGLMMVGMVAVCFSVVGDLFESLLKRNGGYKDSGNILPGHGGVLDRIDGLIATVSIFSAGYFSWVSRI
ncbi:MAG: phosphatidate cytidylyltransferase [Gammaproteobacteria bacterium]